ncbi:MAG TPA: tRNA (N6-threonylcarbamoyladenosine(37)-N6)-methyltransferase TrmO [archaeon]|nr:tRNA (N6-threonylcarbamoyladenosine(37)-N6)-methyltransferase TrmO [archaeon]
MWYHSATPTAEVKITNTSADKFKVELTSIGRVRSSTTRPADLHTACQQGLTFSGRATIVLKAGLAGGLKGLEDFSHIWVIYSLHRADRTELVTHPGPASIRNLPQVGVFASRSQYRPSHLALRLCQLEKVETNKIYVSGLDAIDGTPVLDIKPYVSGFDRPKQFRTAPWYEWLPQDKS